MLNKLEGKHIQLISTAVDTPTFIYEESTLQRNVKRVLQGAEKQHLNTRLKIFVAYFTNSNPHLHRIICDVHESVGILLQSFNEYQQIFSFFGPSHLPPLIASPSVSTVEELQRWKQMGIKVNISSLEEVTAIAESGDKSSIHVRLDLSSNRKRRHGIKRGEIAELKRVVQRSGIHIEGFHIYIGTGSSLPKILRETEEALRYAFHHFPELKVINLGGGFEFDYDMKNDSDEKHFDWEAYFEKLGEMLDKYNVADDVEINIEPGRDIFADSGMFLLKVKAKKPWKRGVTDLCVDGSYIHMPSSTIRKRKHRVSFYDFAGNLITGGSQKVRLAGPTTLSSDFVVPGIYDAPTGNISYVGIGDTGAYASTQFMRFLNQLSAAEVIIGSDGNVRLLTKRGDCLDSQMCLVSEPCLIHEKRL